ncbi:hypothetical protein P7K49_033023 [Saguinus oedipus]|uniref:Uncharacterized protein n=1 Tax=Saguinus oedipus TaxID=9490 RepID=A0ABQ9TQR7_SAGOE|nr:hypothetical protein P7K49_033023 [Saguinus oedipus]
MGRAVGGVKEATPSQPVVSAQSFTCSHSASWNRTVALPGAGPGSLVTAPPAPPLPSRPPVPSAPPRKVEAEALNATAIRVLWRSPAPGRQHGQIRGYQVHYVRMEGAEARGPPRIKDVMLADAQVGGGRGRAPGGGGTAPALPPPLLLSLHLWPPRSPPSSLPCRRLPRSVGDR